MTRVNSSGPGAIPVDAQAKFAGMPQTINSDRNEKCARAVSVVHSWRDRAAAQIKTMTSTPFTDARSTSEDSPEQR